MAVRMTTSNMAVDAGVGTRRLGLRSSARQLARYVPDLTYGSKKEVGGCETPVPARRSVSVTEPMFGSNPAGMLTRAVQDGSDWILNGEKTWITNGSVADVAVVWAAAPMAPRLRY